MILAQALHTTADCSSILHPTCILPIRYRAASTQFIAFGMIMPVDNRRCAWCRRLCRYFGEDQYHHCGRCQMWNNRNRCCQIMNTLCSDKSDSELLNIVRCPGLLWAQILDMTYGSISELDNHVQGLIWRKFLCGPAPIADSSSDSEYDESFLERIIHVSQSPVPPGCSKLWKFWMLERRVRSQTF